MGGVRATHCDVRLEMKVPAAALRDTWNKDCWLFYVVGWLFLVILCCCVNGKMFTLRIHIGVRHPRSAPWSWVDPWGCALALRDEVDGVLGPARVEFWPWRGAHGLEPVAEEAEPRRRASAGARARARGRGPAAVGA